MTYFLKLIKFVEDNIDKLDGVVFPQIQMLYAS